MNLRQPIWPRFLPTRTVLALATLGPIGTKLPAPGTWGSIAGVLYFVVFFLRPEGGPAHPFAMILGTLVLSALFGYLAVAFCGEAEFRLAKKDPGEVILDEFVAMPLVYLGWPQLVNFAVEVMERMHAPDTVERMAPALVALAGFLLFRLFDITKPFGIKKLQDLPGGWGIVLDDTAAALASCFVLHLAHLIFRWRAG